MTEDVTNRAQLAERFLNNHEALLDGVFPGGRPTPNLGLVFDQSETGIWAGSSRRFKDHNLWLDGEQAFVLTHADQPIATVGFYTLLSCLRIEQIQGVPGAKILYQLGRWEHALVRTVERFAYDTEMEEVQVQPASQNYWVTDYLKKLRESGGVRLKGLSPDKAKRRYDDVAVQLGYDYDDIRETYCKRWPFRTVLC